MELNALPMHQEYHTCVWFSVAHGGYRALVYYGYGLNHIGALLFVMRAASFLLFE